MRQFDEAQINFEDQSNEVDNIKGLYHTLLSRDTSQAFILISESSNGINFRPFADLLLFCIAKIELIKNLILGNNFKQDMLEGFTKVFAGIENNFRAIESLSFLYEQSLSSIYADCIDSVIIKLLNLIILYHDSKEIFFKEFADIRTTLSIFDLELLEYVKNIKSSSSITQCSTGSLVSQKKILKMKKKPRSKPKDKAIFIIEKVDNREDESTLIKTISSAEIENNNLILCKTRSTELVLKQLDDNEIDITISSNMLKRKKNVKLSSIKSFRFRQMKRENIDKKVIKMFIRELQNQRKDSIYIASALNHINEIGLPPTNHKGIHYKSFNTSFMLLIFSVKGLKEIYDNFIESNLEHVVNVISDTYNVSDKEELNLLSKYLKNVGRIFSHYKM